MGSVEDYLAAFLDRFTRLIGPSLVLFALLLIGFCTFVFFANLVPFYRHRYDQPVVVELAMIVTGVFLLFNVLYNYYKAVKVSPGFPPLKADTLEMGGNQSPRSSAFGSRLRNYEPVDSEDEWTADTDSDRRLGKGHYPVCAKCDRIRPPRTHHCSVCQSCVYRFDHHCPWIYNCVGLRNYKFFYLFLLHTFLVDVFFVSLSLPVFRYSLTLPLIDPEHSLLPGAARPQVLMSFILASAVGIALILFLGFHTYLLLTNQTTMEWATSASRDEHLRERGRFRRNPYDLGRKRNWEQVFGHNSRWIWAFSFLHKDGEQDGIPSFPTVTSRSNSHQG